MLVEAKQRHRVIPRTGHTKPTIERSPPNGPYALESGIEAQAPLQSDKSVKSSTP